MFELAISVLNAVFKIHAGLEIIGYATLLNKPCDFFYVYMEEGAFKCVAPSKDAPLYPMLKVIRKEALKHIFFLS